VLGWGTTREQRGVESILLALAGSCFVVRVCGCLCYNGVVCVCVCNCVFLFFGVLVGGGCGACMPTYVTWC
jgi:hypothetical protein